MTPPRSAFRASPRGARGQRTGQAGSAATAWLGLAALMLGLGGAAHAADPEAAERAALAKQRHAVQQRSMAEERECASRFAVNNCIDEVRSRRRAELEPIDARDAELDAAQRQRRANERREQITTKQAEKARRDAQAASGVAQPQPLEGLRKPPQPKPTPAHAAPSAPTPAERAAREQAARERYDDKQRDAAAHRAQIERRNAEEKKLPAPPLPPLTPSSR